MLTADGILGALAEHRERIRSLGVRRIGVFGSFAGAKRRSGMRWAEGCDGQRPELEHRQVRKSGVRETEGFEQSVKGAISISSSSSRKEDALLTRTWTSSSSSKISSGEKSTSSTAMP